MTQHFNACRSRDTLGQLPEAHLGWLLAATHPAEGHFVPGHRGTVPLGQLSMSPGDPGKWEGATEQRRMVCYRFTPFPRPAPAPNSWGSRVTLFCGDVEQDLFGGGRRGPGGLTWTSWESGRKGSNLSRIRKLVGYDGWRARIYLGSARAPIPPAPPRTSQIALLPSVVDIERAPSGGADNLAALPLASRSLLAQS